MCVGYALDPNAQPYRFSNINVINFTVEKLVHRVSEPTMTFSENVITMSCSTYGADIYYKIGSEGEFIKYSTPIEIVQDTTIHAYSVQNGQTSETVTQTFYYDDGIEEPVILCDGEQVQIDCETVGADIHYRVGTSGEFSIYTEPFEINSTVTVQAYATLDDKQSQTVSETCEYVPIVVSAPTISCANNIVELECTTPRSEIFYRTGGAGEFVAYMAPFEIFEDTLVEAYSTYKQQTSTTVSETCEYTPEHDYSQDYLTFRVLTSGTIGWKAYGGLTKTIEYSIDDGAWTSLTSTSGSATFSVSPGSVVRFRGSETTYATDKNTYSGFEGGTATFDIEGNVMSLLYDDNFVGNTTLTSDYVFCSLFKKSKVISAEHLILPALTLTQYCYRALFSWCSTLTTPPALPATTLAKGCYWYLFEQCAISKAPELNAATLVAECYGHMFEGCAHLDTIICLASSGFNTSKCLENWTKDVSGTGIYVKSSQKPIADYPRGMSGIPNGWYISEDILLYPPTISFDGETIYLSCKTSDADIHYRLGGSGSFAPYTMPITILETTTIETYSTSGNHTSDTMSQTCEYVQRTPYEKSNKELPTWIYNGNSVNTPFSINGANTSTTGLSRGSYSLSTDLVLQEQQPTYLWFQHADQSAEIYVDDVLVGTHWGGYNAFFFDISNYVHRGTNQIKVILCNLIRDTLAPAQGDFNFNATLGNVKVFTSPVVPDPEYGYDGFHITSNVTSSSATIYVKTKVPSGAQLVCTITDEDGFYWTDTMPSDGLEQTFTTTISGNSLKLWNGTIDPHLYNVKLEIYKDGDLYHRYERPYGFRFYSYVVNEPVNGNNYTGFLLNGSPYKLWGVCMHDDLLGKANALDDTDYDQQFAIIQELGCNFLRLAHYPHPKEVYDRCDQLGIIVQTETPCVLNLKSTMPTEYYTNLTGQYTEMVEQHFNHPCIMFWGLFNETTTDDKTFGKTKIQEYYNLIKSMDTERMVGYVMANSYTNPSSYYNNPGVDWFGCNIYVGWYTSKTSNDPTSAINTRCTNVISNLSKPLAISEYGAGGTQKCHSDDFMTTTSPGNTARHDIEYQMWLHEGHVASLRNFQNLLFISEWQLFDIAVNSRQEGYTECLDGVTTTTNNNLKKLNDKGLVERDHMTKKDTFYIYKAEWNPTPFVHICGKDYTKTIDRKLKCYTNDGNTLSLYNGQTLLATAQVTDHIAEFEEMDFTAGTTYTVSGSQASDTITFAAS